MVAIFAWPTLTASEAFEQLAMTQTLGNDSGVEILTTRLPIRLDGKLLTNSRLAPKVRQHTESIQREFGL
jgi:CoA:oxalate CoA-transferase